MIYSRRNRRGRGGPALPLLAGYLTVTLDTTTYSGFSIQQAITPAPIVGDTYLIASGTSPDGYQILPLPDGTFTVLTGGDNSREEVLLFFRRLSTGNIEGAAGAGDPNPGIIWINEVPPTWLGGVFVPRSAGFILGQPITPIAIVGPGNFVFSSEGDPVAVSLDTGTLPGLTLDPTLGIIGTPTSDGSFAFTLLGTDSTGASTQSPLCTIVVSPPGGVTPTAPTLLAPAPDTAGAKIDAQIAVLQALIDASPITAFRYEQALNQYQVEAVDHYMVTGWANAARILTIFTPPTFDPVSQVLAARVAFLQNRVNNPPVMPPGNADGYGDSGWTTIAARNVQELYIAQVALVERMMDVPGGTTAATIIAGMTGIQTDPAGIPFAYKFASVGFTDADIDD